MDPITIGFLNPKGLKFLVGVGLSVIIHLEIGHSTREFLRRTLRNGSFGYRNDSLCSVGKVLAGAFSAGL